jgi:hypothetical protein
MKKLITLLLALPFIGFAQSTYVPDDGFEQYLIYCGYDNVLDDFVLTANISNVTTINIPSFYAISDLTGIDDFVNLEVIKISSHNFTVLDLSNLPSLRTLICRNNNLVSLNVSNNPNLNILDCNGNMISALDVSSNSLLGGLNISNNNIYTIDLSNNLNLHNFIANNTPLAVIDLSNNPFIAEFSATDCLNLIQVNLQSGGNIDNLEYIYIRGDSLLTCILVDDLAYSNSNWFGIQQINAWHYFSLNCGVSSVYDKFQNKALLKVTDVLGRKSKGTKNSPLFYIYDDGTVEKKVIIE